MSKLQIRNLFIPFIFLCSIVLIFMFFLFDIKTLVILSILEHLVFFIYFKMKNKKVFSLAFIFIFVSYMFHMGAYIAIYLFGFESTSDIFAGICDKDIKNSIIFIILCHFFFVVGTSFSKKIIIKKNNKILINKNTLLKLAYFCCLIGIPSRVYIDITQISAQVNGNYFDALESLRGHGVLSIFGQFFYIGIALLIFIYKDKKNRATIIYLLTILWEIFTMLSGSRIYAIAFVLVLSYLYFTRIRKMNVKILMVIFVGVYFISVALNIIADIRNSGGISFNSLFLLAKDSMGKDNPIIKIICELGGSVVSLIYSQIYFSKNHLYGYGRTYIETVLSIFPLFESNVADIKHLVFIYNFPSHSYLGGSWLGELFYNFSWLGILISSFWGILIGKIEYIFDKNDENDNYFESLFVLVMLFYLIVFVRDYFYKFCTAFQVWGVCVFLCILFGKIKIRK